MKKRTKIIVLIALIILILILVIFLLNKKTNGETEDKKGEIILQQISTQYFSINMPVGYKIERIGEYSSFGIKITDPNNTAYSMFIYSKIEPFNKGKDAVETFKSKAEEASGDLKTAYAMRAEAPIFDNISITNFLDKYNEYVDYAKKYGVKHQYIKIENANVNEIKGYNTYLKENVTTEGLLKVEYVDSLGQKIEGVIAASIDATKDDVIGFSDIAPVTVRNVIGFFAPKDKFDKVLPKFVNVLSSIKFNESYMTLAKQDKANDKLSIINNMDKLSEITTSIKSLYSDSLSK